MSDRFDSKRALLQAQKDAQDLIEKEAKDFNDLKDARLGPNVTCATCFHSYKQRQGMQSIRVCYESPPDWQLVQMQQGLAMNQLIRSVADSFFCSRWKAATIS